MIGSGSAGIACPVCSHQACREQAARLEMRIVERGAQVLHDRAAAVGLVEDRQPFRGGFGGDDFSHALDGGRLVALVVDELRLEPDGGDRTTVQKRCSMAATAAILPSRVS